MAEAKFPGEVPEDAIEQQAALFQQMREMFAGRHPAVVGAVLADLLALLLAGHEPDLRSDILDLYIGAVRKLIPVNEAAMGWPWGNKPEGQDGEES